MINSPFVNTHYSNLYDKIKIFFFIFSGLAFLRLILFIFLGCISSLLFNIFLIGFKSKDDNGNFVNMSILRRFFLFIPQLLARICLFILGFYNFNENINRIFKLNYLERENGPKLIISNHVSFIDSFYFITRGIPSPVANYNVINFPIVGSVFKKLSPILIPTNEFQRNILPDPKTQITERLTHPSIESVNRPLVIFPEGSTKNSKYLLKFQNGAFMDNVIYQPILLKYDYKYLDPSWSLDTSDYKLLFLMCCQFVNKLHVTYLEPTNLPADEIRKIFISKLNLIDSTFSNHDNNILKFNIDKKDYIFNYILQDGLFTMEFYKKTFKINTKNLSNLINKFYDLDIDKNGSIVGNQINVFHKYINKTIENDLIILNEHYKYNFYDALKFTIS